MRESGGTIMGSDWFSPRLWGLPFLFHIFFIVYVTFCSVDGHFLSQPLLWASVCARVCERERKRERGREREREREEEREIERERERERETERERLVEHVIKG